MGKNSATINYAFGSAVGNTFNMYLFGSGILTFIQFWVGLIQTQSVDGAARVATEYFIQKLTPFPIDELLVAGGVEEFITNVFLALCVGLVVGSLRYRNNRY
jgi:hypothetical protein